MRVLLLHPPFADPTQPYLSLPTLKGALRAAGLDARVVDVNVEAAHWLLDPDTLEDLARRIGARFSWLNDRSHLTPEEREEYAALRDARPKIERVLGADPTPLEVFRTRELFFDAAAYSFARRQVEGLFDALNAAHWPLRFGFNTASHGERPWSFDLLDAYALGGQSPLLSFYERFFASAETWDWDRGDAPPCDVTDVELVGVSIVFPSQIPEALHLARFLKRRAPGAFVLLGGPAIHQVAIHLDEPRRLRLLAAADAIGLFEGEELLRRLIERLPAWRGAATPAERFEILADVPNLLVAAPDGARTRTGPRWTLDLRDAAPPDYTDLDLDRYLAPSRTLLYAPTRGCYWGECSFCYYGLTETATASYREIPPERAATELGQLARRHGVRNVYLSCDVLSPKYALRLADALIAKGVKIRWSSDLKIERYFTPERCQRLFESGLRSAAFGIESGSDRILELMRKGCDRATMTAVNRAFHDAGVATEWMTFTDHPDETVDEALETVKWIEAEQDAVDLFFVGRFGLESGAHVAQDPVRYGIRRIFHAEGDDLRLYAQFTHAGGPRSADAQAGIDAEVERLGRSWALHPYPWAGAISTHHTFLHVLEFGPRAFRTHFQRAAHATHGKLPDPPVSHIAGLRERPRHALHGHG